MFTPTSASWLNLVERWLRSAHRKAVANGECIEFAVAVERGRLPVYRCLDVTNEDWPFVWTKTADQILASVASFCQRTLDTGH